MTDGIQLGRKRAAQEAIEREELPDPVEPLQDVDGHPIDMVEVPVFTTAEHLAIRKWLKHATRPRHYDDGESVVDVLLSAGAIDQEAVLDRIEEARIEREQKLAEREEKPLGTKTGKEAKKAREEMDVRS